MFLLYELAYFYVLFVNRKIHFKSNHYIMKLRFYLLMLVVFLFSFSACKIQDEFDELKNNYHPEVAVPLFYAKTSFKDIVGNKASALKIDSAGKMRLYYKGTVSEQKATDALKIFPTNGIQVPFADTSFTAPFKSDLDLYNVYLAKKTMLILGCQVLGALPSQIVDGTITLPNFTKNGVPFKHTFSQTLAAGGGAIFGQFSLEGYVVKFGQPGNTLTFKYQAKGKVSGQDVKLLMAAGIQNIGFTYCEAFMQKQVLALNEGRVELDFYDEQSAGSLKFEDPKITVLIENSYGFPMRTKINYVKSINVAEDTIALSAKGLTGEGFDFPYPSINEIGKSKFYQYTFNKDYSTIKDMLNSKPKKIIYDIDVTVNPNEEKGVGFITDSTTLKVGIEVDIPLYGTSKDFNVNQEFQDIDFKAALANASEAELKLVSDNSLPVEVLAEIEFMDKDGKLITKATDKAFSIIKAAAVDAKGNVTKAALNEVFIPLDAIKTDLLRQCTKAKIKFYFSTSNNGTIPVSILSTQEVNVRMGLKAIVK